MKQRFRTLIGFLAVTVVLGALPALADPPETSEEPIFVLFPDFEHDMVVFWNITRADFCDWSDIGFEGDPPVIELVEAKGKETGQGAFVASWQASRDLELWKLDDPGNPQNACADTDGQDGPWASGSARVTGNDNDLDVSGTRRNSFGHRGQGKVTDVSGDRWHYSWNFTAQCSVDCSVDFVVRTQNTNLHKIKK